MGDTKLLEHKRIDPKVAESWRGVLANDFLSDITWEVATSLGYERPTSSKGKSERKTAVEVRRDMLSKSKARRDRARGTTGSNGHE